MWYDRVNYLIVFSMNGMEQSQALFFHEIKIYWYRRCTKFYATKGSEGLFVL
jgi:hypothetical protein